MKKEAQIKTDKENTFLKIKEAKTIFGNYFYAERKGVDSIAFILQRNLRNQSGKWVDPNQMNEYGLINEFKPPIGRKLLTAFGGSLDSDRGLLDTLATELHEEAGYGMEGTIIMPLGKVFVSTQMNQWCHLFMVYVENAKYLGRKPETRYEEDATIEWVSIQEILQGDDWKSLVILERARRPYSYAKSSAA